MVTSLLHLNKQVYFNRECIECSPHSCFMSYCSIWKHGHANMSNPENIPILSTVISTIKKHGLVQDPCECIEGLPESSHFPYFLNRKILLSIMPMKGYPSKQCMLIQCLLLDVCWAATHLLVQQFLNLKCDKMISTNCENTVECSFK